MNPVLPHAVGQISFKKKKKDLALEKLSSSIDLVRIMFILISTEGRQT